MFARITEDIKFERWSLANFPDIFQEWEVTASEWLTFADWVEHEYSRLIDLWAEYCESQTSPLP